MNSTYTSALSDLASHPNQHAPLAGLSSIQIFDNFIIPYKTFTQLIGAKSGPSIIIRQIFQNCWDNISSILHLDDLYNTNHFNLTSSLPPSPSWWWRPGGQGGQSYQAVNRTMSHPFLCKLPTIDRNCFHQIYQWRYLAKMY